LGTLTQNKIGTEIVSGNYAFVHLFVTDSSELQQGAPQAVNVFSEDTVFWISYPKPAEAGFYVMPVIALFKMESAGYRK
jgi:hypothetical protein